MNAESSRRAKFSLPSILAIVAALTSFATGALLGFILAIAALGFGVLGIVLSLSPGRRGGIMSFFAIVAGLLGLAAAVFKGLAWLV